MGQAKARGSYEVRKAQGEAKRKAEAERLEAERRAQAEQREAERLAREAALTPEQRVRRRNVQSLLTTVLGVGLGLSARDLGR